MCLKVFFFFNDLINLPAATDFPSLYVEYISMLFTFKNLLKMLLQNSPPIFYLVFFLLRLFFKCINNANSSFVFKVSTHAYLLKRSIAHNKNLIPLLYLLNNCISAKSTPQILPLRMNKLFFSYIF